MNPNRAKKVIVTAPLAALNRGSLKSVTSSIGFGVRRSQTTKVVSSAAETTKPPTVVGDDQPWLGASMIVTVSVTSIATDSTRPTRSSPGTDGSRDSGTKRNAATAVTSARGTRAQNTLPQ